MRRWGQRLLVISFAAAVAALPAPVRADSCTFTNGDGDYAWSNAGNWSCGRVPLATDSVAIDQEAHLDVNTAIVDLTLEGAASLMPAPQSTSTFTLAITGDIEWTGGSIGWDGTSRLVVDWRSRTGDFIISGADAKAIYRTGRIASIVGGRPITIEENVNLEIEDFNSSWSLYSTGSIRLGNNVSLTGDGTVFARRLIANGEAFVELSWLGADTTQLGNSAVLSVSGGRFSAEPGATVTGDPATPNLDGGRLITGAPLPGQTEPNPTTVDSIESGTTLNLGTATWEHRAGPLTGKFSLHGSPTSMPFVWSGGELSGEIVVDPQASLEIISDGAEPVAITGASSKLTIQGDLSIAESTHIDIDAGSAISVTATGNVNQYLGAQITGSASGSAKSTITNDGTWSAFGPLGTVTIENAVVRGTGTWKREEEAHFEFQGGQPVDLANLHIKVANNHALSAVADTAVMRIRKLSVTSGAPSQQGFAITVARAQQLNTTGMTTTGLAISPTLAYVVSTPSNTLVLTPSAAVPLSLECQLACPSTAKVNQPWNFSFIVSAPGSQATGVVLKISLPPGMTAYRTQGSCAYTTRTITCQLGTVTGTPQQVFVRLRSSSRGAKAITSTLTANEAISDPGKASKSFSVRIAR
jgi:hypothetical protein